MSASNTTVRVTVEILTRGNYNEDFPVSATEWNAMDDDQRDEFMKPLIEQALANCVGISFREV
ncbi:hypothetical protein GCM10017673_38820 [Streptosporangium violaceochromogenes]|nr:hypothetical protein GCM10017673_38820 [Streptosporangium violaceochromogenes]